MPSKSQILNISIDNLSFNESLKKVLDWGLARQSGFVCFANVHMAIEAYRNISFKEDLQKASLVLPDGKPIALACKWLYKKKQERIAGMDFMPALLNEANKLRAKVFLFGSTQQVLEKLTFEISMRYPNVSLAGAISPPFRNHDTSETITYINKINSSEANFIFIALGCPKQEKWMVQNFQKISGILLGVGGAFPVIAGIQKRCPKWMSDYSLEWFYRFLREPRRLFKRYFLTNFHFSWLIMIQIFKHRISPKN